TRSASPNRSSCELRRGRSWPCEKRVRDPPEARIPMLTNLFSAKRRAVYHHGSKLRGRVDKRHKVVIRLPRGRGESMKHEGGLGEVLSLPEKGLGCTLA